MAFDDKTEGKDDEEEKTNVSAEQRKLDEIDRKRSQAEREFMFVCKNVPGFNELWADIKALEDPEGDDHHMIRCAWGITRMEVGPKCMVAWAGNNGWNMRDIWEKRKEALIKSAEEVSREAIRLSKGNKKKQRKMDHVAHKRKVAPSTIANILKGIKR